MEENESRALLAVHSSTQSREGDTAGEEEEERRNSCECRACYRDGRDSTSVSERAGSPGVLRVERRCKQTCWVECVWSVKRRCRMVSTRSIERKRNE